MFIKMAEDIINKKLSMRNILKKIVESKFEELEEKISQEINDDLKLVVTSKLDAVKRKVAAIKKLEDETIDICENEEQLVIESVDYKIYTKQNIAQFSEFLNKNFSTNTDRKVQSNIIKKSSTNVHLLKLEILKFAGEPKKWQTFIDLYETVKIVLQI